MKSKTGILITLLSLTLLNGRVISQACCTAGTPLLGSLEMTSAPKGILQFGLSANYNSLNDVFDGNIFLEAEERKRVSKSLLFEINYGLSNRISLTALFSYTQQSRTISTLSNLDNELTASGIGDLVLLSKYSLIGFDIFNRQELSFGIGLKLPLGNSSIKDNGILIPADMQPGTGSWDIFLWSYYSKSGLLLTDLTFIANISYRMNGTNNRFENFATGYGFGNEFIGSFGFNYPINTFIDFTLISKYRNTQKDSFGSNDIPNTGGNWLYIVPGISFYLGKEISARLDGEFPTYTNVFGTQLTTTFSTTISFFYSLNFNEGSF